VTGKIGSIIDELPQASKQRVEEIIVFLEGVLSDIECAFPIEDDSDSAYECANIPKARELIALVSAWNANGEGLKTGERESGIHNLSKELKTTFNQI
jgi:hypothetical protein